MGRQAEGKRDDYRSAGRPVTGTGPLAGTIIDSHGHRSTVPRFHFTLQDVTQMHADIGWFLGALVVALVIGMRYGGAPARVVRLGWIVLAGLAVQGTLGYIQYFAHLPAGLVWVHVATSVVLWTLVLRLLLFHPRAPAIAAGAGTGHRPGRRSRTAVRNRIPIFIPNGPGRLALDPHC